MRFPLGLVWAAVAPAAIFACGLEFQGAENSETDASRGPQRETGAAADVVQPNVDDGALGDTPVAAAPSYCDGHAKALLCEDFERGLASWSALPVELRLEQTLGPATNDAGGGGFAIAVAAPEPNKKTIVRSVAFTNTFSSFSVSAWVRPHTSDNDPSTVSVIAAYFFASDAPGASPVMAVSAQLYRDQQNVKVGGIWLAGDKADADPLRKVIPIDEWGLVRHDLSLDTQTVSAWFGSANPDSETDANGERGISFKPATIRRIEVAVGAISARNDPGSVNALVNATGSAWQYSVDNILVEGKP